MRAPNTNFSDTTLILNSMTVHSARILMRLTVLSLCLALPLPSQAQDSNQLDWSPIETVPEALRDVQCEQCKGRYIDPLAGADTSIPPEQQEIHGTALSTEMLGNNITLSGGVVLQQGYRTLKGDTATIDREAESGTLTGNITIREPGLLLRGERADFSAQNDRASVQDSQFVLHSRHLRGRADTLVRDKSGLIHIEQGGVSYCAPDDNDWAITADNMVLDLDKGVGTARGAKLRIGGVPIIYTPWISFPLDDRRKSGFLWPNAGNDTKGGLDISTPIYLNLAPNYDALYIPRFIAERGLNHELKTRYLGEIIGEWAVSGAYMASDKRFEDEFADAGSYDRWIGIVKHNGIINQRWRSSVDYSKASDVNYIKDLNSSSLDNKRQTALLQRGAVDYLGDDWLLQMEVQEFQTLADDINDDYKKLPQIDAQYRGRSERFSINPILLAQYSHFDTDLNRVTGERFYAEAGAEYPMQWQQGFLTPRVKYRALEYQLEQGALSLLDDSPSSKSALASLDGGLFFERSTNFAGKGYLQTLEPRLFYLYSEFDEQLNQPDFDSAELTFTYNQLFRETRFSGRDRLDDANQVAAGLTTRFIGEDDGHEYGSASIGQIYYFKDRKVRLNATDPVLDTIRSELAAELNYSPSDFLDIRGNVIWDPYKNRANSGSLQANFKTSNGALFNAGYTFRRSVGTLAETQPDTEQVTFSTYLPVWSKWSAFASISYSLEAKTDIEDMFGLEYDNCCWTVRILHLQYFDNIAGEISDFSNPNLEREKSTQVQFVLKGMGGVGSRISGILKEMIRGYEEREY
ncbi:MAG: LPS-assembly protein [Halioglobus sp.]|jgi:LPS-assembly protein